MATKKERYKKSRTGSPSWRIRKGMDEPVLAQDVMKILKQSGVTLMPYEEVLRMPVGDARQSLGLEPMGYTPGWGREGTEMAGTSFEGASGWDDPEVRAEVEERVLAEMGPRGAAKARESQRIIAEKYPEADHYIVEGRRSVPEQIVAHMEPGGSQPIFTGAHHTKDTYHLRKKPPEGEELIPYDYKNVAFASDIAKGDLPGQRIIGDNDPGHVEDPGTSHTWPRFSKEAAIRILKKFRDSGGGEEGLRGLHEDVVDELIEMGWEGEPEWDRIMIDPELSRAYEDLIDPSVMSIETRARDSAASVMPQDTEVIKRLLEDLEE